MRRRRPNRLMTRMAIVCVGLLVNGCEAQVWGTPPAAENTPQAPIVAPQASRPALPEAPPDQSAAPLDGLDARVRQATADAAESGAHIETAVLDRNTGQIVSNGANTPFPHRVGGEAVHRRRPAAAGVQGPDEAFPGRPQVTRHHAALLRRQRGADFLGPQRRNAVIARVKARYGLAGTTAPYNGHWDVTTSTASDLVRYYDMLLDGTGGLPPEQANVIIDNLAQSTPTGTDGYPQRFGIPEGLYAEPVAVKQGWFCCWNGGNQLHVTTGMIGLDRRYVMAIGSLDPTGEAAARDNLTQVVKTMFPGGKI